jgi:CHAT domain-containing protein/Flp pilus assembly protein TadD
MLTDTHRNSRSLLVSTCGPYRGIESKRRDASLFIHAIPNKKVSTDKFEGSAGIYATRFRRAVHFVFLATRSVLYMPPGKRVTPTMSPTEKMLEPQSMNRRTAFISWQWLAVGALIVVMLIAGALVALKLRSSDAERGTNALIDAFSKRRLIEPRLSGGFKCGEFRSSPDDDSDINRARLDRARGLIADAVAKGDPRAQLAYARLLLSEGDKPPEALKYLRRAVASAPESAEAHNDLGVCLIQQDRVEDAIDEFEAALKYKVDMPEALFNRGLCYQRLLLRDAARADYQRLLETERDNSSRDEVKRRIEDVSRPPAQQKAATDTIAEFNAALSGGRIDEARRLVDENSELVRRHALWDVGIQHLQAAVNGDYLNAERALSEVELIGSALVETKSDSSIADIAKYLRNLPDSARPFELELIRTYVDRVRNSKADAAARPTFERLVKRFRERGNHVFEAHSAFGLAECYYGIKRFADSIKVLKDTFSLVESREWPRDQARVLNLLALQYSRLGQDSLAIKHFQRAISLCNTSPELEAKILQYMSVPYQRLGDWDAALARLRDSTKLYLETGPWPGWLGDLAYNYSQIADIYSLRSQHALALLYSQQAFSYSERAGNVAFSAEFSSFAAVEHARLDQFEMAEASMKRASDYLDTMEAGPRRDQTQARIFIYAGEVAARVGDLGRALEYYNKAEDLASRDEGHVLSMIEILLHRARAYAALGQTDAAHSDLIRAVSFIEDYRANIDTSDQRSQFLAASHDVFNQLISLAIGALGNMAEAFEMSERSRARALLEEVSLEEGTDASRSSGTQRSAKGSRQSRVKPLKLVEVQSQLPDDLTLLEYVITEQRTYLFLVTHSDFKVLESQANTGVLDRLVHDYVSDLKQMAPLNEVNEKARALYDYLIKPVEGEISASTNLCIVPDEALHFLPFAGLVDESNKYLIESHRLTYVPSASVFVRCIQEDLSKPARNLERILAVGNPDFNRDSFSNLPSLAEAEREATESARFYSPDSVVLKRAEATESRVLTAMKDCDVAHLALHCLVEEGSPGLAALVLAGATPSKSILRLGSEPVGDADSRTTSSGAITRSAALSKTLPQEAVNDPNDGLLFLKELYDVKLPRTRLVVLSACQSGLGQYYRGEGIVSLVRPLLAAGVPTVVVSLWPVDSQATSELMIEFHRQRRLASASAADALRSAQIKMEQSGAYGHPYYWAPFTVVGSSSARN